MRCMRFDAGRTRSVAGRVSAAAGRVLSQEVQPAAGGHRRVFLDLGEVRNVAQMPLSGKDLAVVWTAPWRVQLADVTPNLSRLGLPGPVTLLAEA